MSVLLHSFCTGEPHLVLVKKQADAKQITLPLSNLAAGIYFMRAGEGGLKKVVITR